MQILCSILKILHLTKYSYTGTAHGARNNYQVCIYLKMLTMLSLICHNSNLKGLLMSIYVAKGPQELYKILVQGASLTIGKRGGDGGAAPVFMD